MLALGIGPTLRAVHEAMTMAEVLAA